MQLESLIENLGGCGVFQIGLTLICRCAVIPIVWGMLLMMFAGKEPDWWCIEFGNDPTFPASKNDLAYSYDTAGNSSMNMQEQFTRNMSNFKQCTMNVSTCNDYIFSSDMVTVISEFGLVCDKAQVVAVIISIQMSGVLIFAVLAGQLGDMFGRKKTLFLMLTIHSVFSVLCAFATTWQIFAIFQFFVGGGGGGVLVVGIVVPMEFSERKYRSAIIALPVWAASACFFALVAWILPNWNHICIATGTCTAVFLLSWWFVPESVRWLLAHNRVDETEKIFKNIARYNKCSVPDREQLEHIMEVENRVLEKRRKYTYLDLLRTKSLLKKTVVLCYLWMFCDMVYYMLSFGAVKFSGNLYINILLTSAVELPGDAMLLVMSNTIGRRWTCLLFFMIAGVSSVAATICTNIEFSDYQDISKYFALVAKFGVTTAWMAAIIFSMESFPTVVRNLGHASVNTAARVGSIIAPQLIFLTPLNGSIMYVVAAFGMFTSAGLVFLIPETKGQALEDTLEIEVPKVNKSEDEDLKEIYPNGVE